VVGSTTVYRVFYGVSFHSPASKYGKAFFLETRSCSLAYNEDEGDFTEVRNRSVMMWCASLGRFWRMLGSKHKWIIIQCTQVGIYMRLFMGNNIYREYSQGFKINDPTPFFSCIALKSVKKTNFFGTN